MERIRQRTLVSRLGRVALAAAVGVSLLTLGACGCQTAEEKVEEEILEAAREFFEEFREAPKSRQEWSVRKARIWKRELASTDGFATRSTTGPWKVTFRFRSKGEETQGGRFRRSGLLRMKLERTSPPATSPDRGEPAVTVVESWLALGEPLPKVGPLLWQWLKGVFWLYLKFGLVAVVAALLSLVVKDSAGTMFVLLAVFALEAAGQLGYDLFGGVLAVVLSILGFLGLGGLIALLIGALWGAVFD